jgi:hypothetical protein
MTLIPSVLLAALTVLLLTGSVAGGPPAQAPDPAGAVTLAGDVASKISYQGRLTDAGGNPLDGDYDLVFQLWNDATAGSQAGGDVARNDVPVTNGMFTVELDVPQDAFNGQALWLRIQVGSQWLSPRQELLPVPYALGLKPGARVTASSGTAATFYSGSGVGLHAQGHGGGVEGVSTGPSVGGVSGQNDSPDGRGVHGLSAGGDNGIGVYGRAICQGQMGCTIGPGRGRSGGTGVYGFADGTDGVGVYGESAQFYGGFFRSDNDHLDLALGGAVGRINTDPDDENSDLILSSNNDVTIKLDNDAGEEGMLRVENSGGGSLLAVEEAGNVGIGTVDPEATLHVAYGDSGQTPDAVRGLFVENSGVSNSWYVFQTATAGGGKSFSITNAGNVGVGTADPQARLDVDGTSRTKILEIIGGSDLAEPFEIVGDGDVKPGTVVAIDPRHPGQLRVVDKAYDPTVAGCVSGANGLQPGLTMQQAGTVAEGAFPVALSGRVYCLADAAYGPILPGDLLTTSDTPGHAMKATDREKSFGSVIGKAMSSLEAGRGLVLMLVTLQ